MPYKIINTITGEEWKAREEIVNFLEGFEERGKTFRVAELFLDNFADLELIQYNVVTGKTPC